MKSKRVLLAAAAILCTLPMQYAAAQEKYPCDIVKFVVPYPPGGASDPMARMLIPSMSKSLGTTFVVENIPGAGGSIGVNNVMNAKADGCTVVLGGSSAVIVGRNLFKMNKDPLDALVPVAQISSIPMVLYANPSVPAKTVPELVKMLKDDPEKYNYGSPGSGTMHHLLAEMFKAEFGLKINHIPYRGAGPTIQDVLGGHLTYSVEGTSAIIPHLRAGKVIGLATTAEKRSAGLPELPTMTELGHPNLTVTNWFGIFAPKGTPPAQVAMLNKAVREAQETPDVKKALLNMDSQHTPYTPEQLQAFVKKDAPRWEAVVKKLNLKVE